MPTKFSPAFDAYVEPARENNEIWRTILGFVLVAATFLAIVAFLSAVVILIGEARQLGLGYKLVFELQGGRSVFATFAAVGSITILLPALWIVVHFLHRRSIFSLIAPNNRISWRYWQIAAMVVALIGIADMILTFSTTEATQQLTIARWIPLAFIAAVLVFLQTAAEELIFRGYLQQQLAARFQSRWIWLVLPSVGFGALHWNPGTFGGNAWLVIVVATLIGLIAGDMTARLGNLSAAMGMHFANNILVFIFLNVPGQSSGVALYLHDLDAKSPEIAVGMGMSIVIMIVIYSVFLMIMRQRR